MATCGGFILKLVLLLFNLAWLAIGSVVLYLGVHIQLSTDDSIKDLEHVSSKLTSSALVLIIVGGIFVLIAAVGFLGACCESSMLLKFYGIILVVLLVVTLVGMFYGHKHQDELSSQFNSIVAQGMVRFEKGGMLAYSFQKIQTWMQCCGWNGPQDYNLTSRVYPSSCCKVDSYSYESPTKTCTNLAYNNGCKDTSVIQTLTANVIYATVFTILIQLVVILATCCFASEIDYPHNAY